MRIEIITSPNDELKETGFGSHLACASVVESIKKLGHMAKLSVCTSSSDLDDVVKRKPDLVILAAKYIPIVNGNDIWFSEYFYKQEVVFSGSDRETLKYDSDKVLAKSCLNKAGINTAKYFTAVPGQYHHKNDLPLSFPLFLKPIDAANGNGIDDLSFVENFSEFEAKVASLYNLYQLPILVEEYLSGREFTVAIIENDISEFFTSAIEIIPPESAGGLRILGAEVKKYNTETLVKIKKSDIGKIVNIAIKAFIALGVRGFGRIDVKMDSKGKCYFMEANLIPGMNFGSSYFPQACSIASSLSYDKVISLMLMECLSRVPRVIPAEVFTHVHDIEKYSEVRH
jgi:D-alanine-D-alanine ligase